MPAALLDRDTISAALLEQDALAQLDDLLQLRPDDPATLVVGEHRAHVPPALLKLLKRCVRALHHNQAVALLPLERLLTTQEAADLLNVSRPYLIRLLDRGDLLHTRTGTHRRIQLSDLLTYQARRNTKRRGHLRQLSRLGQELETRAASHCCLGEPFVGSGSAMALQERGED